MSIAELFILAVGLSMDAFAVSVCKGLSLGNIKVKHMCIAGVWFGGFQALMPLIGYFLGSFFADMITKYAHWIAFLLLLFLGGSMVKEAFTGEGDVDAAMDGKSMFLLAVATSIDALAVGVTFAFFDVNIVLAITIIGIITFIVSYIGVLLGKKIGKYLNNYAEIVGGIILILIGLSIFLNR